MPSLPKTCFQCGQILFADSVLDITCGACIRHPPPFDRTFVLFPYESPIVELISKLKFHQQLSHAVFFSSEMIERIQTTWYPKGTLPELIVPMPLHPKRLRERGFNQANEIAKPIAKYFKKKCFNQIIQRVKHTQAQSGLLKKERYNNIKQAFLSNHDMNGKTIAILDDVITTGATVSECSKILKKNGAKSIHIWCAARA